MSIKQREQQAFKGPCTSPSEPSFPVVLAPGMRSCLPCAALYHPWAGNTHPRAPSSSHAPVSSTRSALPTSGPLGALLSRLESTSFSYLPLRGLLIFQSFSLSGKAVQMLPTKPISSAVSDSRNSYRPPTTLTSLRGVIKKYSDGECRGQGPPNGKAGSLQYGTWRVDPQ